MHRHKNGEREKEKTNEETQNGHRFNRKHMCFAVKLKSKFSGFPSLDHDMITEPVVVGNSGLILAGSMHPVRAFTHFAPTNLRPPWPEFGGNPLVLQHFTTAKMSKSKLQSTS